VRDPIDDDRVRTGVVDTGPAQQGILGDHLPLAPVDLLDEGGRERPLASDQQADFERHALSPLKRGRGASAAG